MTRAAGERAAGERARRREVLLCACGIAGPVVWFVLLCSAWAIAPAAHEPGSTGPLLGLHALALVAAAVPGLLAYRDLRRLRRAGAGAGSDEPGRAMGATPAATPAATPDRPEAWDSAVERTRFLAGAALALSALAVLLVIASAVPLMLLVPGAEP